MRSRKHLTYANVMSTLCLVAVIGSGTAYAATHLPAKSVGTKQLKAGAVTPAKLAASLATTKDFYNTGLITLDNGQSKVLATRGPFTFTAECTDEGSGASNSVVMAKNTSSHTVVLESDYASNYAAPQLAPGASTEAMYSTTNSSPYFFGDYYNTFAAAGGKTSVNGFGSIGSKILGHDCVFQLILVG